MTAQNIRDNERSRIANALRYLADDFATDGEDDDALWTRFLADHVESGEVFTSHNDTTHVPNTTTPDLTRAPIWPTRRR